MADDADDKTDAAALGAGVVAVAMTVFGDPSDYDLLTLIVSVALLLLILGYIARSRRDWRQSLAFASVLAIIALPILGWLVEGRPGLWAKTDDPGAFLTDERSSVSDEATVIAWLLLTLLTFLLDRRLQRSREQPVGE